MHRHRSLKLVVAFVALTMALAAVPVSAATEIVDTQRISIAADASPGDGDSYDPVVSADASIVVFNSYAANLVDGDTNGVSDVFMYEAASGKITRISMAPGGGQANADSVDAAVSADGSIIAFASYATNLVPGDTNAKSDIFVYDVAKGETTRISVPDAGGEADDNSDEPSISADGSIIAYTSLATNLVPSDTNEHFDAFMYDAIKDETTRISVADDGTETDHGGEQVAVSADGSTIVYRSYSTNLVAGDTNGLFDVFAYDVGSRTTTLVSVASDGTQADNTNENPSVSADGSTIVYSSFASSLVSGDTNKKSDIFAHDVVTGATVRVSVADDGTQANSDSYDPIVSADGSTISYHSLASNLVAGDTSGKWDVLAYDVDSDTTTRVSVATDGASANGDSWDSALSADGFTIVYYSEATNLDVGDTNGASDIFVTVLREAPIVEPPPDTFIDDNDSIFEADIEWMAAEGITKGCNPPANDRFCPNDPVTRGQMAAFLVRAMGYADNGGGDLFIDDDDSIFEGDIDRLGTAGVTRGCNPPVNDRFCPTANVSRGQMAAFLHRALG